MKHLRNHLMNIFKQVTIINQTTKYSLQNQKVNKGVITKSYSLKEREHCMKYLLKINTANNKRLFYQVTSFDNVNGFIRFVDEKTKRVQLFPIVNVEIEELERDGMESQ